MIGQLFGNYRALSLLGQGGMGAVYLAEHPEIGRKVAIKVLHTEFSKDAQLLGRFLNEARAANAIRHPNIIEILDSGTLPQGGPPFLVMEFLEGESLASRVKRVGRLSLSDAVEFTWQTASALGAAHKQGIVHRDLKPDNLFVVPAQNEGERERLKVLDFGIAKLQRPVPGDSVKTRTGTLMGTPVYMSPEQCRGTKPVDQRSDIYSLGVILYQMLVGRPPFVSEGFGDLVNMHINVPPPPLSLQVPTIPGALEALVLCALAKNPDDRFQNMADMQAALKPFRGRRDFTTEKTEVAVGVTPPPRETLPVEPHAQTTLTTGTGEQRPHPSGRGRKGLAAVLGAAAALGLAFFLFRDEPKEPATPAPAASIDPEPTQVAPAAVPVPARVAVEQPVKLNRDAGVEVSGTATGKTATPTPTPTPTGMGTAKEKVKAKVSAKSKPAPKVKKKTAADEEPAKL